MKDLELILIENILDLSYGIEPSRIVSVCDYGSATYETMNEKSDRDYVVVVDMQPDYLQFESPDVDIHILSISHYKNLLNKHDIMALEAYFNPSPIVHFSIPFELDLVKLRHSISAVVSNSWVKAKKKVELENEDSWIGYKSLFHSMRILDFGIQLAESKKIYDYSRITHIWYEILKMVKKGKDIESIMNYYKLFKNGNSSKFKQLAPKK